MKRIQCGAETSKLLNSIVMLTCLVEVVIEFASCRFGNDVACIATQYCYSVGNVKKHSLTNFVVAPRTTFMSCARIK